MVTSAFVRIKREELEERLRREQPNNEDRERGYALVNVLKPEVFAKEHIPGSINIPAGNEDEFERRFSKDKEIIVYCASPQCDAAPTVAAQLARRGFSGVRDYTGGMSDWQEGGNAVATGGT